MRTESRAGQSNQELGVRGTTTNSCPVFSSDAFLQVLDKYTNLGIYLVRTRPGRREDPF
jgi:hypothetical protein